MTAVSLAGKHTSTVRARWYAPVLAQTSQPGVRGLIPSIKPWFAFKEGETEPLVLGLYASSLWAARARRDHIAGHPKAPCASIHNRFTAAWNPNPASIQERAAYGPQPTALRALGLRGGKELTVAERRSRHTGGRARCYAPLPSFPLLSHPLACLRPEAASEAPPPGGGGRGRTRSGPLVGGPNMI